MISAQAHSTRWSAKLSAINERKMLWLSRGREA